VLITANDYNLRLFNGDLGITLLDPEAEGKPRVFFRTPEGASADSRRPPAGARDGLRHHRA